MLVLYRLRIKNTLSRDLFKGGNCRDRCSTRNSSVSERSGLIPLVPASVNDLMGSSLVSSSDWAFLSFFERRDWDGLEQPMMLLSPRCDDDSETSVTHKSSLEINHSYFPLATSTRGSPCHAISLSVPSARPRLPPSQLTMRV